MNYYEEEKGQLFTTVLQWKEKYHLVSLHEVMSGNVLKQYGTYSKHQESLSTYLINYYLFPKRLNLTHNRVFQREQ